MGGDIMKVHRPNSMGDFAYSRIRKTPNKHIELNSLIGAFPCSPSPAKEENVYDASSPLLATARPSGGYLLPTQNQNDHPNKESRRHSKHQDVISIKSVPVVEDQSTTEHPLQTLETPPTERHKGGKWVGIGIDGETMSLSVCSNSIDSSVVPSPCFLRSQNIPKAIDIQIFEPDNLPVVGEGEISTANADIFLKSRSLLTQRVQHDVEELSLDLSRLEDAESVASVITKEEAHELSKRLGEMEEQLLELAGEKHSKEDAIRALAKVTSKQEKKVECLQRKTKKQAKKISTLTDLCQRLTHGKGQDKAALAGMQQDMKTLQDAVAQTTLKLRQSEARNRTLTSQLSATTTKLGQMEEESVQKSRLLLHSYSDPCAGEKNGDAVNARLWLAKYDDLREEGRRRAVRDGAAIRHLESQMAAMVEAHAKEKRRSERKMGILMEMKAAMEEQIRLLEGNDDSFAK